MALALAVIRSRPILLRSLLPSFLSSRSSSSSSNDLKSPLIASLADFPSPAGAASSAGDPNLPSLLHLVSAAKSHSPSQQEALTLLRSSSAIKPTENLVCSALWELRADWESAALVFKWAWDCVADCPRAWHVMIWVLGSERRFDLAWSLLRRMRRKSVLTPTAMVIMMERDKNLLESEALFVMTSDLTKMEGSLVDRLRWGNSCFKPSTNASK